jgi:hypothetical protein
MDKVNIDPEIREIRLDEVVPAPYNPRKIGDPARSGLKASIESFGYAELMVVNRRNMRIVGGCQRYEILKALGAEKAEVVMVDLDETMEKALAVTLNNKKIAGRWSADIHAILAELKEAIGARFQDLKLDELRDRVVAVGLEDRKVERTKQEITDELTCPSCGLAFKEGA